MSPLPDDPLERGLREKLLGRTRADLARLNRALDACDFPTIVHLAHRLGGAAGALGLEDLSVTGRELEREGARGDAAAVRARLGLLVEALARAKG
ncbi:MAG TPA: Hpt domain-containing protein [Usitatibacter sp.]|jgi:HPt (histidine-containing phosphotransfer) domain-containing protein|nr:Hpt domain-containing protein [Usitatibacter sp.]